jgi:hypothetical protein
LLQLTGFRKWIADAPVSSCCSSCFTPADGDVGGTRAPFFNSEANPTHITSKATLARRRTEEFVAITTMAVTSPDDRLMITLYSIEEEELL